MSRLALLLTGCVFSVPGLTFRTKEGATAFERAVAAIEKHCHGVRFQNPEAQIVTSKWNRLTAKEGVFVARCQVSVVKAEDEVGADVRVASTIKQCPSEETDPDSAECTVSFSVPRPVAEAHQAAIEKLEYEVRR